MKRKLNTETIKTYIVILLGCSCICLFILGLIVSRRTESYNDLIEGLQKTTYSTAEFSGEVMTKRVENENYSLIMSSGDDVCVTKDQYEQISIGDIITYYRTTYTYQKPICLLFPYQQLMRKQSPVWMKKPVKMRLMPTLMMKLRKQKKI